MARKRINGKGAQNEEDANLIKPRKWFVIAVARLRKSHSFKNPFDGSQQIGKLMPFKIWTYSI